LLDHRSNAWIRLARFVTMFRGAVVVALLLAADGARIQKKKSTSTCGAKGASAPPGRIVNGEDATECEWKWQAQLRRGYSFCGGTLISPDWVLTAAHCVGNTNFDVRFGDHNVSQSSSNVQTRRAAKVYAHPKYETRPTRYDLAMVKLDSPVEINDCVAPACLPEQGDDVNGGEKCWITGWGTLRSGGNSPKILQEGEVTIVSNDDCVNKFGYSRSQIDDTMICAQGSSGGGIVDACQGDSGGPLVCESNGRWSVYGATSWGRGCAGANYPGVWARVHKELDWIQNLLDGNEPTEPPAGCPWYCGLGTCLTAACKDNCPICQ